MHCYAGKVGDQVPALFAAFDGIVAIVSLGAVVRLIAPHLKNKETDPAVVVIDEAGRFVIPVLSGHLGGANQLAGHLATALGAQAVLTTGLGSPRNPRRRPARPRTRLDLRGDARRNRPLQRRDGE